MKFIKRMEKFFLRTFFSNNKLHIINQQHNAKILDKRAVYGSTVYVKVNSKEFGRIAAQIAKAIILQKLREEENRAVYERYKLMERDLVSGVISRHFERRGEDGKSTTVNVSVNLGKAEATLMAGEQIKAKCLPC